MSLAATLLSVSSTAEDSKGTLSFALENDLFGAGTDKHYTHGTELSYVSDTYMPAWFSALANWLPFHEMNDDTRFSWALGQKIYTPDDIAEPALIEGDRPYAGWLYLSLGLTTEDVQERYRHVDSLELIGGVVGPKSGAEDAQIKVHKIVGSTIPRGWSNQLDNEYTLDLRYRLSWMYDVWNDNADLIPAWGFTLGTSQRRLGAGLTLRVGSGLTADYGPPLIRPSSSGSYFFRPNQALYWYLFAGAHAEYVDYNIFLDGNRDGNSHRVKRKEHLGNAQVGLVMGAGNWRVTLTNIYYSREFEGQEEPDEFGSIAIAYRF